MNETESNVFSIFCPFLIYPTKMLLLLLLFCKALNITRLPNQHQRAKGCLELLLLYLVFFDCYLSWVWISKKQNKQTNKQTKNEQRFKCYFSNVNLLMFSYFEPNFIQKNGQNRNDAKEKSVICRHFETAQHFFFFAEL